MNVSKLRKSNFPKIAQAVLPYLVILFTTFLMVEYQMKYGATFITGDRFLHFYRFYDTSMQIKTGNFSLFQTNYGFNQSGRIFNALYGPFFAYLNGLVLILCGTWFRYQILVDFVVNLVGGIGMYRLGKKVKVNDFIALLLAVLYLQFGIIVGILRANNFMAWGAAFAPFVIIQAVNMVQDHKRPIHWITLALIMGGVAQVHVLSTVFLAFTLIPFAIYGLVNTPNKKQMILDFFKAVGSAIVLTANIWGSFLVVYPGNKISTPNTFRLIGHTYGIAKNLQYSHGSLSWIIALMLLAQLIYIICHFKKSPLNDMVTLVGLFILLLSSKLFPWDKVQGRFPRTGSFFQFPYRLAVGAIPLLLLGLGITLTYVMDNGLAVTKKYVVFVLFFAIMQTFAGTIRTIYAYTKAFNDPFHVVTMGNYYWISEDRYKVQYYTQHTNNGEIFKLIKRGEPDYLPMNPHADNLLYRETVLAAQDKYPRKIVGDKMYIMWNSKKADKRILPIVMYHRSHLIVNGKDQTNAPKNTICNPTVQSKKGENVAVLSYQVPVWFYGLLVICLAGWLSFLVVGIRDWIKKRNGKN